MPDLQHKTNPRVAIYTIALNEAKHVERFMENIIVEADHVLVLDTGSTDDTIEMLQKAGADTYQAGISPFRFDTARNTALSLLPADIDICISLDLDEILTPGWRTALEKCWTNDTTRVRYNYIWNWTEDGKPVTTFYADKIHARHGYRWVHPVHETLSIAPGLNEKVVTCDGFTVEHHADNTKSRGQYLQLLEMSVREDPDDPRCSHYLAREYSFYNRWDDVLREGARHLSLKNSSWQKERAKTMRLLAYASRQKGQLEKAASWLYRAIAEDPRCRENYIEMGECCLARHDYQGARYFGEKALDITQRDHSYLVDQAAWTWKPYDLIAIAAYYLGELDTAFAYALNASQQEPGDRRLQNNLALIEAAMKAEK